MDTLMLLNSAGRKYRTPRVRGTATKTATGATLSVAQGDFTAAPQAGDLLVAICVGISDADQAGTEFGASAGWSSYGVTVDVLGLGLYAGMTIFTKVAGPSEGTYLFAPGATTSQAGAAHVYALAGATQLDYAVVHPTSQTGGSTTKTAPAVTTFCPGSLLISVWMCSWTTSSTSPTWTTPGSMTKLADTTAGPSNVNLVLTSAREQLVASGSTGTRSATVSKASPDVIFGASVAIRGVFG